MVNFDTLRRQHDDALAMADRLIELVDNYNPASAAIPILMQLNRLLGILRVHFACEDIELYRWLMESRDPNVARTARVHFDEMGGLSNDFECFARHWSCSASIANNFDEFREGTHELMLALAVRIEREHQYLYPLAEAETAPRRNAA